MLLKRNIKNFSKIQENFIVLFGVPGVGKGTYGKLLQQDLEFHKLTPGDIIRKKIKNSQGDELTNQLKSVIDTGKLVNDDLVQKLIMDDLYTNKENTKGLIFDGFPRNIKQIKYMTQKFDFKNGILVNIFLNEEILIEKLLGRRVCSNCGQNYNICSIDKNGYEMEPLLPKIENKCDNCGSDQLVKRDDDTEEIIHQRIEVYNKETHPVFNEFENTGIKILNFEPKKGIKDYPQLYQMIKNERIFDQLIY